MEIVLMAVEKVAVERCGRLLRLCVLVEYLR